MAKVETRICNLNMYEQDMIGIHRHDIGLRCGLYDIGQ
jgi:hypothetical protein